MGTIRERITSKTKNIVYKTGPRKIGKMTLIKIMNYYKFHPESRNKFISSYNKYLNSLNNVNNKKAYNNAEKAAENFIIALITMYEKSVNTARTPVSRGIANGTRKTLLWWLPGVIYRGSIKHLTGPKGPRLQTNLN
jgi:hypothetical protein